MSAPDDPSAGPPDGASGPEDRSGRSAASVAPIVVGAMAGLGIGLLAWMLLGATGLLDPAGAAAVFAQFLALFAAGFFAGRLGPQAGLRNGGLAGLVVFATGTVLAIAGGDDPGLPAIMFFGAIAIVLGTAGALLASAT